MAETEAEYRARIRRESEALKAKAAEESKALKAKAAKESKDFKDANGIK